MKLDIKTIIGIVVIAVVAYLCRPLNYKITEVLFDKKNNSDEEDELSISGNIDGHDYVDLGLSVKWATCNIGAAKPKEYGNYFAWGETGKKYRYDFSKYSWRSDDAANAQWGESWRMPTKTECDELVNQCSWKWTTIKGVKGYKVMARNGNWIFLPAAGYRNGDSIDDVGAYGHYWSSTVNDSNNNDAYGLRFDSSSKGTYGSYYRAYGHSVRPVAE